MGCNYCFGCGADLAEDAKVCPSCGKKLDKLVNPPPLKVSEESRQAFKRNIPAASAPPKIQPQAQKSAPVKRVFIKVPPTKGSVIANVIIFLNALTAETILGYQLRESLLSPFADDELLYYLIVMLIFLPLVVIPITKLKPRRIGSDQELVKKKTSLIRKIGGLLYGLPVLAFAVLFIYREVQDIMKYFVHYSWISLLLIFTVAVGLLSIAGMGIRQLFPQLAVQNKAPETEEQSVGAEKVSLEKEKRD